MRTIACLNWKGGSGKSTTALALAVGLARRLPKRQRVLLVNNDPQANSTLIMLDGRTPEAPTLADVLLDDALAIDAIRPTRVDRLDILPADGRLADCTVLLADELGRERRLRVALRSVEGAYGVCVVERAAPVVAPDRQHPASRHGGPGPHRPRPVRHRRSGPPARDGRSGPASPGASGPGDHRFAPDEGDEEQGHEGPGEATQGRLWNARLSGRDSGQRQGGRGPCLLPLDPGVGATIPGRESVR